MSSLLVFQSDLAVGCRPVKDCAPEAVRGGMGRPADVGALRNPGTAFWEDAFDRRLRLHRLHLGSMKSDARWM